MNIDRTVFVPPTQKRLSDVLLSPLADPVEMSIVPTCSCAICSSFVTSGKPNSKCLNTSKWLALKHGFQCCCTFGSPCDPRRKIYCSCTLCSERPDPLGYWFKYLECYHRNYIICRRHLKMWLNKNLCNRLCECNRAKLILALKT